MKYVIQRRAREYLCTRRDLYSPRFVYGSVTGRSLSNIEYTCMACVLVVAGGPEDVVADPQVSLRINFPNLFGEFELLPKIRGTIVPYTIQVASRWKLVLKGATAAAPLSRSQDTVERWDT